MEKIKRKTSEIEIKEDPEGGVKMNMSSINYTSKCKISKPNPKECTDLNFNDKYLNEKCMSNLTKEWHSDEAKDYIDTENCIEVYRDPFQICLLPDFMPDKKQTQQLMEEIISKVNWSRKQMDLYEFYQSNDLSNMIDCPLLSNFLQILRNDVCPWLEKITNIKLDYVSSSCSMYTCGDYLLVHDDLFKDRRIAFIYYLSPWNSAEQWNENQGGCLEIFNRDEHGYPYFPVQRKIPPKNNQFAFFKVSSRSFHQVGEVTSFDFPRITINGWFHGPSNEENESNGVDTTNTINEVIFKNPQEEKFLKIESLILETYLLPNTRKKIQKCIENNSEISLYEFLRKEFFEEIQAQLLTDVKLKWKRKGPAYAQNYEVLDITTASGAVERLVKLFTCFQMFELLRDYTDLDFAGSKAITPGHWLELQRWSHGNYTVLGDCGLLENSTLDIIFYLNSTEGAGTVTYLSPDENIEPKSDKSSSTIDHGGDNAVLLTITPVDNSLNMVYRCDSTTKFTKYVSCNTPMEKGPVFILSCSYKE